MADYADLTSEFSYKDLVSWINMDALSENDHRKYLPAGTDMAFFQATAPTGWTKQAVQNDKILRVISGSGGGSGGTIATSTGLTLNHFHTLTHSHVLPDHRHDLEYDQPGSLALDTSKQVYNYEAGVMAMKTGTGTGSNQKRVFHGRTDEDGSVTTSETVTASDAKLTDTTLAYVDVIICAKDAGSYTDLTTTFGNNVLITWDNLDELSENDDFDHIAAGTDMAFFQTSAPTGWTKQAVHNDKVLRVTSGAGGGAGGSHAVSGAITLAHIHTEDAGNHTHTFNTNTHNLEYEDSVTGVPWTGEALASANSNGATVASSPGTDSGRGLFKDDTDVPDSGTSGTMTYTTDSQLSNLSFAYIDMIICSKDSDAAYTDMTSEFAYKDLMTYQNMDKLAENDGNDNWETDTVAAFYQASPPGGWSKETTHNNKAMRVTTGAGGGSGGSQGLSTMITLAHTHTATHNHTYPNHSHLLLTTGVTNRDTDVDIGYNVTSSDILYGLTAGAGNLKRIKNRTASDGGGNLNNDSTALDSKLTDTTFAYVDMILGKKS